MDPNWSLTNENSIAHGIIGAAIRVHSKIGPGLLESAYALALRVELEESGFDVREQVAVPMVYKGKELGVAYKLDMLVNDRVIVEIKSVEALAPVHYAQTLTYLRLADKRLGLLMNFNCVKMREGIHRVVNKLEE
ncbi:MAG: GxxExxY protein [Cyclobacteriaceae bacterium]|nr:GxxExxY protein [Cyclobacteriaceae bacterium]